MEERLREANALLAKIVKAQAKADEQIEKVRMMRDELLVKLQDDGEVAKAIRKKCYIQTRIRRATTPEIEAIEEEIAELRANLYETNMDKIQFLQSEGQLLDEQIDELTTNDRVAELEEQLFLLRDKTKLPVDALRAAQTLVIRSDEE